MPKQEKPITPDEAFRETAKNLKSELTKLVSERERIDKRILTVRQVLSGLDLLADDEETAIEEGELSALDSSLGVTDLIREVLRAKSPVPVSAREVKDELVKIKPSIENLQNPLAAIHTILKRLVPKEAEIVSVDNKVKYRAARPALNNAYLEAGILSGGGLVEALNAVAGINEAQRMMKDKMGFLNQITGPGEAAKRLQEFMDAQNSEATRIQKQFAEALEQTNKAG